MSNHIFCVPYSENILSRLQGRAVIVRVVEPRDILGASEAAHRHRNHLHCIVCDTKIPLARLELKNDWKSVPLAFFVPEMGRFVDVLPRLSLLRQLNVKIYLPVDRAENLTSIRVLSSLGVATVLTFGKKKIDWEAMADLATYACLGKAPHAPIEPFHYLVTHYQPDANTDFASVYFEDPNRFIHIGSGGHLALSTRELKSKLFIADDLDVENSLTMLPKYQDRIHAWRLHFSKASTCSFCPAWRVCLGKMDYLGQHEQCGQFFTELMDTVEQAQSFKRQAISLWQL